MSQPGILYCGRDVNKKSSLINYELEGTTGNGRIQEVCHYVQRQGILLGLDLTFCTSHS